MIGSKYCTSESKIDYYREKIQLKCGSIGLYNQREGQYRTESERFPYSTITISE